jgi:hypothetical protein
MTLHKVTSSAAAEWVAFLFHIQEVLGSNPDAYIGHPDKFSVIFLALSSQMPK